MKSAKASGERKRCVTTCVADSRWSTSSPRSSRTTSSLPQRVGGSATGGGGTWVPDRLQQAPDEALGGPARQADGASRPAGAHQLGGRAIVIGGEHDPDGREHVVERRVLDGQGLGVRHLERDRQALGRGTGPRGVDQLGDVVDPGHVAEGPRCLDGHVACPAGDIEHGAARSDVRGRQQRAGERDGQPGDLAVVAAAPDLVLLGLQLLERRDDFLVVQSWVFLLMKWFGRTSGCDGAGWAGIGAGPASPGSSAPRRERRDPLGACRDGGHSPMPAQGAMPERGAMDELRGYDAHVRLLEREHELAVLAQGLRQVAQGPGVGIALAGDAGTGKSSTVMAALQEVVGLRILRGQCDPLGTPRPLGPLREVGLTSLAELVLSGAYAAAEAAEAALGELAAGPTVLVVEDLHWADAASADVLRYLVRRVETVPLAVLLTYRDAEIGPRHPARQLLGDFASLDGLRTLTLQPLSVAGAAAVVDGTDLDPTRVHELTGGNPFYVSQVALDPHRPLPTTVRDTVLARTAEVEAADLEILQLVACSPDGLDDRVLPIVGVGLDTLHRLDATTLLVRTATGIAFRHELARQAIETTIPPGGAPRLHERLLAALEQLDTRDPATLTHHAIASRNRTRALTYSRTAAAEALATASHAEAASFLEVALEHLPTGRAPRGAREPADPADPAALPHRPVARGVRDGPRQHPAVERGRPDGRGGRGPRGAGGVGVPDSAPHLERPALRAGLRPGVRVGRTGHHRPRPPRCRPDRVGRQQAGPRARVRCHHHLGRSRRRPAGARRRWRDPRRERGRLPRGRGGAPAGAGPREHRTPARLGRAGVAGLRHHHGGAHGAGAPAGRARRHRGDHRSRHRSRPVDAASLGRVVAFRGARVDGPVERRARGRRSGDRHRSPGRVPVAAPRPLRRGDPHGRGRRGRAPRPGLVGGVRRRRPDALPARPPCRRRALVADRDHRSADHWVRPPPAARAGRDRRHPLGHRAAPGLDASAGHRRRGPRRPARAVRLPPGRTSRRGSGLVSSDGESFLGGHGDGRLPRRRRPRPGGDRLDRLGATATADRLRRDLRADGVLFVPKRPSGTTRANPGGLTNRQLEVARLLARGMTNAEIADVVFISPKTAEHHVSAVLSKLGLPNRRAVVRAAEELGLA